MGPCEKLLEPLRLGLAILFHVFPALGPADDRAQGNDENIDQPVLGVSTPGITHMRERVKQASGSGFFHWHSFSKVVYLQEDATTMLQVYGLQDHHGLVCDALGIDRSWYVAPAIRQNHQLSVLPPLNVSSTDVCRSRAVCESHGLI